MADIFCRRDVMKLLKGKRIVFFGDSNMRRLYKDLIWLLNSNTLTPQNVLNKKGENSLKGDRLVKMSQLTASRDFKENRKYKCNGFDIEFIFITRVISEQVTIYMNSVKRRMLPAPDIVVMNSTFWDLTRWGPRSAQQFQYNLISLMGLLMRCLPQDSMFIWTTALPPSRYIRKRSFLIKQVEFLDQTLKFDVFEANFYAKNIVASYGYDVLDFHYHLRYQIHRRCPDGLHYKSIPIRFLTNILLTHIALSLDHPLPRNIETSLLSRYENSLNNSEEAVDEESTDFVIKEENNSWNETTASKGTINDDPMQLTHHSPTVKNVEVNELDEGHEGWEIAENNANKSAEENFSLKQSRKRPLDDGTFSPMKKRLSFINDYPCSNNDFSINTSVKNTTVTTCSTTVITISDDNNNNVDNDDNNNDDNDDENNNNNETSDRRKNTEFSTGLNDCEFFERNQNSLNCADHLTNRNDFASDISFTITNNFDSLQDSPNNSFSGSEHKQFNKRLKRNNDDRSNNTSNKTNCNSNNKKRRWGKRNTDVCMN